MPTVNQKVSTPLGAGTVQGPFAVNDANGESIVKGVLVRLPVNDQTKPHLKKSNCITPKASLSALFVFQEEQLTVGR